MPDDPHEPGPGGSIVSAQGDEIQFEEVSYREPRRLRRPDRDRAWATLAYGTPGPDDLPIFLSHATADRIERHALSDVSVELGGILLGRECIDEETGQPFVWVFEMLEAKHYENTQASFTYTHDSWGEITRERDETHPDLDIVGWYHTHPDFGIFLSGHDVFIQKHFFSQPLQVAYVVDPIRQTRGFFRWIDGALGQVEGYHLVAPRRERLALARGVNDLEGVPNNAEAGGHGGMSPRLEAELIAMLNRPQSVSVPIDRGQSAAVFSLLGMVMGILGVALALWIADLTGEVRDQGEDLAAIRAAMADANEGHASIVASERVLAKERALDALLASVRVGDPPERFMDAYATLLQQRDRAVEDGAVYDQIREDLLEKGRRLEILNARLESQRGQLDRLGAAERIVEQLRVANASLTQRAADAEALEATLRTYRAIEDGTLPRRYAIAWYAAAVGWGMVILMGLGLIATVARLLPGSGKGRPEDRPQGGRSLAPLGFDAPDRLRAASVARRSPVVKITPRHLLADRENPVTMPPDGSVLASRSRERIDAGPGLATGGGARVHGIRLDAGVRQSPAGGGRRPLARGARPRGGAGPRPDPAGGRGAGQAPARRFRECDRLGDARGRLARAVV